MLILDLCYCNIFLNYFTDIEYLGKALTPPAEGTAGGSLSRLCGQIMSGVDSFVFLVKSVLEYTFLRCTIPPWSGFRQVARAIEGGTIVAWFA